MAPAVKQEVLEGAPKNETPESPATPPLAAPRTSECLLETPEDPRRRRSGWRNEAEGPEDVSVESSQEDSSTVRKD